MLKKFGIINYCFYPFDKQKGSNVTRHLGVCRWNLSHKHMKILDRYTGSLEQYELTDSICIDCNAIYQMQSKARAEEIKRERLEQQKKEQASTKTEENKDEQS